MTPPSGGDDGTPPRWAAGIGPFLTLGLQLALTVVVMFFAGRWLDGVCNTAPWLMIAGTIVGVVGSLIKFIRTALELGERADNETKRHTQHTP